jgi:hypothetical protein
MFTLYSKLQFERIVHPDPKLCTTVVKKAPRVTVVGEFKDGVLNLAVSRCSEKDNFSRKIGRVIAIGRLQSGKIYTSISMKECDIKAFLSVASTAIEEVMQSKQVY